MQTQTATLIETLPTRFGEIFYDETKTIIFPNGILGLPDQNKFLIAPMPDKKMEEFQVLQSLCANDVSFAAIPLISLGNLIDQEDLDEARNMLGIEAENLFTILIVSRQNTASGLKLSANLRAPILVDTQNKTGYQMILPNSKYPVEHFLN